VRGGGRSIATAHRREVVSAAFVTCIVHRAVNTSKIQCIAVNSMKQQRAFVTF
jgi:hypothetical protein